ncbi:MAG: hypothetical protein H6660_00945 [Ardenticatenaceae bacterium]|nr:hypothetical protein [Ardenticatenaceae bacterium]
MIYPAKYRDSFGEEITQIKNDGQELRILLRGVLFLGNDFDTLSPQIDLNSPELATFTLVDGTPCNCEIECEMPMPMATGETGTLFVHLTLGAPLPNGALDNELVRLRLQFGGLQFESAGKHGYFEDELWDIEHQLPQENYMKCCLNCAFSDYFPAGSGLFGHMACFRDSKEAYRKVRGKGDLFQIWEKRTAYVQETFLCPDFEKRIPGTGYRG